MFAATLTLGEVADFDIGLRLRIDDVAEEDRGHAVFFADFPKRIDIELPAAHRRQHRFAVSQIDEARPRLRRLDLLLKLARGTGVDGTVGIGTELDDAERP